MKQSAVVIMFAGRAKLCATGMQKRTLKSFTEAEVAALSDGSTEVL